MTCFHPVAIIMPFFNVQDYLKESIESILAQDYPHYELILVNDGSTDGSTQIARDYAQRFAQIRLIEFDQTKGTFEARRAGVANIEKGDYVLFVDADDLIKPHTLSALLSIIKDTDMVHFPMWKESNQNSYPDFKVDFIQQLLAQTAGVVDQTTLLSAYCNPDQELTINWSTAGSFYKKSLLDKAYLTLDQTGLIPKPYVYSEDSVLFVCMMLLVQNITFLEEPLYFYRYVPKSYSCQSIVKRMAQLECSIKIIQFLQSQTQNPLHQAFCLQIISNLNKAKHELVAYERHSNKLIRRIRKIKYRFKRTLVGLYVIAYKLTGKY